MNIRFRKLILYCKKDKVEIKFAKHVTLFHGEIFTGKSTIARLIDFCLGSRRMERIITPALKQEGDSVELLATIGNKDVTLRRALTNTRSITVIWQEKNLLRQLEAPLDPSPYPIWNDDIFNFSDLIFHLSGTTPVKVPQSARPHKGLTRLSFRDLMWFCYLRQKEHGVTFFHLEGGPKMYKSRYALQYIVGLYTNRIETLEIKLRALTQKQKELEKNVGARTIALIELGFQSEITLEEALEEAQSNLDKLESEMSSLRREFSGRTHTTDQLRQELRRKYGELEKEEEVLVDLDARIREQKSLRAEIEIALQKHIRITSAVPLLSGVSFERCPACGNKVRSSGEVEEGHCNLCGRLQPKPPHEMLPEQELLQRDFKVRIGELTESIEHHQQALKDQERRIAKIRQEKADLDSQLVKELEVYDSDYLAKFRAFERNKATIIEKIRNLKQFEAMFNSISRDNNEIKQLKQEVKQVVQTIRTYKMGIKEAHRYVKIIAEEYKRVLIGVGVPKVTQKTEISLNPSTWIPIFIDDDNEQRWDYYGIGSAGTMTLLKTCFALALHVVTAKYDLPLPTFLIIDVPMTHISEEVEKTIFKKFYDQVYELVTGPLSTTQLIVIDKAIISPSPALKIDSHSRLMKRGDPDNLPLIPYYQDESSST